MNSIYDTYMRENIMTTCESHYKKQHPKDDAYKLTEEERNLVLTQIDYIMKMVSEIIAETEDETEALTNVVDKLIGFCIISKLHETKLCRILNERDDEDGNV